MTKNEITAGVRVRFQGWDFRSAALNTNLTGTVKVVGKGSNPLVTIIPDEPEALMNPKQSYPKPPVCKSRISDVEAI